MWDSKICLLCQRRISFILLKELKEHFLLNMFLESFFSVASIRDWRLFGFHLSCTARKYNNNNNCSSKWTIQTKKSINSKMIYNEQLLMLMLFFSFLNNKNGQKISVAVTSELNKFNEIGLVHLLIKLGSDILIFFCPIPSIVVDFGYNCYFVVSSFKFAIK